MRIPFGEWMPDQPDLENAGLEAKNVIPYGGRYKQIEGISQVSDMLSERPYGAFATSIISTVQRIYVAGDTAIYELDDFSWTDRSGAAYVLSDPAYWDFTQFGRNVLAANYENTLQYVDFVAGGNFADVTSGPKARHIANVRDFVMVGNMNDAVDGDIPHRVQWSALDDPLDWPTPGTDDAFSKQSDFQDLDAEDGAVMGIIGLEFGLIFQERSITRASYVGSPLVFQFDKIDTTRGALTYGGIAKSGESVYFLSQDGFYVQSGNGESKPIGHGRVDRYFFDDFNKDRREEVRAIADPERKVVMWSYPSKDAGTYPDKVLIYSYNDDRWSRAVLTLPMIFEARTPGYTLDNIDSFGTVDTIGTGFDDPFWAPGQNSTGVINGNLSFGTLTGDPLDACIDTGSVGLEGRRMYVEGVRPLVEGDSNTSLTIQIGYRNLQTETLQWTSAVAPTSATGKADFRVSSFFQRFRVLISGGFDDASGVDAILGQDDSGR